MKNPLSKEIYQKRQKEREEDVRGPYFRDQTAIIHSLPFRRLKNKTQVFFAPENDHICTRIEHVLHVSTIAATICKGLSLDVELAQAIALGHDLGHPPFGHVGEEILNEIFSDTGGFVHELHALRIVDKLTNHGRGLNLTYAVRDGIVSHFGEEFVQFIEPSEEVVDLSQLSDRGKTPSTLEGCTVRMADKIAYLGRDIEDAIKANLIEENDIPGEIRKELGTKNGEIINTFVTDMIKWSRKHGKIGFSPDHHNLMKNLKEFNYKRIYNNPRLNKYARHSKQIIQLLTDHLRKILTRHKLNYGRYLDSDIPLDRRFGDYLSHFQSPEDKGKKLNIDQIVLDYTAGMTDQYALKCVQEVILPEPIKFEES